MGTTSDPLVNRQDAEAPTEATAPATPRYSRRLSDKILIAFHQACDQADFEVAERLLKVLESMIAAERRARALRGSERRRDQDTLVAAYERLWQLRHPGVGED